MKRRTFLFLLMALLLTMAFAPAADSPPELCKSGANLMPNCTFSEGFNGWQRFLVDGGADFTILQGGGECHAPECPAAYIVSNDYFVGGIYQQVTVTPGNSYRANVVWLVFDSLVNDNSIQNSVGRGIGRQMGIDPTGGTDPNSPNIVWGPENWRNDCKICDGQEVTATAQSDKITVFLRIDNRWKPAARDKGFPVPPSDDKFWIDDIGLVQVEGEAAAPPAEPTEEPTEEPSPEPAPTNTPEPSPEPTATAMLATEAVEMEAVGSLAAAEESTAETETESAEESTGEVTASETTTETLASVEISTTMSLTESMALTETETLTESMSLTETEVVSVSDMLAEVAPTIASPPTITPTPTPLPTPTRQQNALAANELPSRENTVSERTPAMETTTSVSWLTLVGSTLCMGGIVLMMLAAMGLGLVWLYQLARGEEPAPVTPYVADEITFEVVEDDNDHSR